MDQTMALTTRKPHTTRKRKPGAAGAVNATGRLDLLAMRLGDELVRRANPSLQALYQEFKPELVKEAKRYLGPRNKRAQKIREFVINSRRIAQAQAQAQANIRVGGAH